MKITIIGAGIVGLATALKLLERNPSHSISIIEKESQVAQHQTGNNSGVIHSGIYYKPGSLKAQNCKNGYDKLIAFAKQHHIAHDICGKIIVATQAKEIQALNNIYNRGVENNLTGIRKISASEIKEIEPHCVGLQGVWVPQAGIINYTDVSKKYAELIVNLGGKIFYNQKVIKITETEVITDSQSHATDIVINCAGLYSDKIAKLTQNTDFQILPFRGEYYELVPEREHLIKNLIYPVPNPDFPFLGVHFTRMIHGGIEAGPNAVLAFGREAYKNTDVNFGELIETLAFSGFRKVATKYWREGWDEMRRSYSKRLFTKALQALIPEIKAEDLVRGGAGIRAQACMNDGTLADDFLILQNKNIINVCNAPSPAATSSLSIGEHVASLVEG